MKSILADCMNELCMRLCETQQRWAFDDFFVLLELDTNMRLYKQKIAIE